MSQPSYLTDDEIDDDRDRYHRINPVSPVFLTEEGDEPIIDVAVGTKEVLFFLGGLLLVGMGITCTYVLLSNYIEHRRQMQMAGMIGAITQGIGAVAQSVAPLFFETVETPQSNV